MAEIANYRGYVALFAVDQVVEMTHVRAGDFTAKVGKSGAKLWVLVERGLTHDGHGVVGRKVVAIIFEDHEVERIDDAIGRITGNNVDLVIFKCAVNQPEVHDARGLGEVKSIAFTPAFEPIRAFEKFEADADTPLWSDGKNIGGAL